MRSKLGTKSRLAAHILALILLFLMLVYLPPNVPAPSELRPMRPSIHARQLETVPPKALVEPVSPEPIKPPKPVQPSPDADPAPLARHAPPGKADTLDKVKTKMVATHIPASQLRPPGAADVSASTSHPAPGIAFSPKIHRETLQETGVHKPVTEPLRPPSTSSDHETLDENEGEGALPTPSPFEDESETAHSENDSHGEDSVYFSELESSHEELREEVNNEPNDIAPQSNMNEEADEHEAIAAVAAILEMDAKTEGDAQTDSAGLAGIDHGTATRTDGDNEHAGSGDDGSGLSSVPDERLVAAQPDESGALVVAPPESGTSGPIAVATPLTNANLEVLGDGIFWLDPRHDLEKELATIPEIGTLVLLTPLPGFQVSGFAHVKTELIPSDSADIMHDSADHFLHVLSDASRPIVVAPLPGARGAGFFKGAYLLTGRHLTMEEVMREIEPELEQAGETREEIIHRLLRFSEVDG